jgi:hypothetical protein
VQEYSSRLDVDSLLCCSVNSVLYSLSSSGAKCLSCLQLVVLSHMRGITALSQLWRQDPYGCNVAVQTQSSGIWLAYNDLGGPRTMREPPWWQAVVNRTVENWRVFNEKLTVLRVTQYGPHSYGTHRLG